MKIKIRGIQYYYNIHQQKDDLPYLILLHGFMGSSESFDHLLEPLKKFCNPVTIDLLGHGQTEGSEMHYRFSSKEQTADIVKLIAEQLKYPLFLHGYSMGGRLALQVALQRPDLFQGLVLESTTFGIENEQERQARQALDEQRADSILSNFQQFIDDWKLLPLFNSRTEDQKAEDIQRAQNPYWMSNSLLGFGTGNMPYLKDHINKLQMPVQLLAGEHDQKFTNVMSAMNNRIDSSSFKIFENANHRVHSDQPESFINTLMKFIQTNTLP